MRERNRSSSFPARTRLPGAVRRETLFVVPSPQSFPEKGRGISGRKYEGIRSHSLSLASTHIRVCVRRYYRLAQMCFGSRAETLIVGSNQLEHYKRRQYGFDRLENTDPRFLS